MSLCLKLTPSLDMISDSKPVLPIYLKRFVELFLFLRCPFVTILGQPQNNFLDFWVDFQLSRTDSSQSILDLYHIPRRHHALNHPLINPMHLHRLIKLLILLLTPVSIIPFIQNFHQFSRILCLYTFEIIPVIVDFGANGLLGFAGEIGGEDFHVAAVEFHAFYEGFFFFGGPDVVAVAGGLWGLGLELGDLAVDLV